MQEFKVLIADHDTSTRQVLRYVLRSLGCTPIEASDGAAALETIEESDISGAILDADMPKLSGIEVLRALRTSPHHSHLPVAIISGPTDAATVRQAVEYGVDEYLVKPFGIDASKQRLQRLITMIQVARARPRITAVDPPKATNAVLVVDGQDEFQHFVTNALAARCTTIRSRTGIEALKICAASVPPVIFLGDDIGLLTAPLLAERLRRDRSTTQMRIVRIAPAGVTEDVAPGLFDATLSRTFVPAAFVQQFDALFTQTLTADTGTLAGIRQSTAAAAQQAVGMMAATDVMLVPERPASIAHELDGMVVMHVAGLRKAVRTVFRCSRASAALIAARMLGAEPADIGPDDQLSVVGEILNMIVGRVQEALTAQGTGSRFTLPELSAGGEAATTAPDVSLFFQSATGDLSFAVELTTIDRTVQEMAQDGPGSPAQ